MGADRDGVLGITLDAGKLGQATFFQDVAVCVKAAVRQGMDLAGDGLMPKDFAPRQFWVTVS